MYVDGVVDRAPITRIRSVMSICMWLQNASWYHVTCQKRPQAGKRFGPRTRRPATTAGQASKPCMWSVEVEKIQAAVPPFLMVSHGLSALAGCPS